ncbi:hypothetical protein BH10PSE7_BH10PSE7_11670 [soil metagenome]
MDWNRAIAINQSALIRIVAMLIAMVGLTAEGMAARLPRPLYYKALGVLRPAEAAVRRLIVIAARGIAVKPSARRPVPGGVAVTARGRARVSFQLFDPPWRFDMRPRYTGPRPEPRISVLGAGPLVPLFQPQRMCVPEAAPDDGMVSAGRLGRRLAAIRMALENLPCQVKRLARWRARRDWMARPMVRSPLRPGPPPGHRKKPKDEVHRVLRECHALARDALAQDTS